MVSGNFGPGVRFFLACEFFEIEFTSPGTRLCVFYNVC